MSIVIEWRRDPLLAGALSWLSGYQTARRQAQAAESQAEYQNAAARAQAWGQAGAQIGSSLGNLFSAAPLYSMSGSIAEKLGVAPDAVRAIALDRLIGGQSFQSAYQAARAPEIQERLMEKEMALRSQYAQQAAAAAPYLQIGMTPEQAAQAGHLIFSQLPESVRSQVAASYGIDPTVPDQMQFAPLALHAFTGQRKMSAGIMPEPLEARAGVLQGQTSLLQQVMSGQLVPTSADLADNLQKIMTARSEVLAAPMAPALQQAALDRLHQKLYQLVSGAAPNAFQPNPNLRTPQQEFESQIVYDPQNKDRRFVRLGQRFHELPTPRATDQTIDALFQSGQLQKYGKGLLYLDPQGKLSFYATETPPGKSTAAVESIPAAERHLYSTIIEQTRRFNQDWDQRTYDLAKDLILQAATANQTLEPTQARRQAAQSLAEDRRRAFGELAASLGFDSPDKMSEFTRNYTRRALSPPAEPEPQRTTTSEVDLAALWRQKNATSQPTSQPTTQPTTRPTSQPTAPRPAKDPWFRRKGEDPAKNATEHPSALQPGERLVIRMPNSPFAAAMLKKMLDAISRNLEALSRRWDDDLAAQTEMMIRKLPYDQDQIKRLLAVLNEIRSRSPATQPAQ